MVVATKCHVVRNTACEYHRRLPIEGLVRERSARYLYVRDVATVLNADIFSIGP